MAVSFKAGSARQGLRLAAAGLALLAGLSGALAQGLECSRLQAQIASMGPGDANAAAGFADAARRQQYELERTQNYAQSIGCNSRQILFFGSAPPAQCGDLKAQIQRMRDNLAAMQAQERRTADGGRAELVARFNAMCRGEQAAPARSNLVDRLFGVETPPPPSAADILADPLDSTVSDDPAKGGAKLVCVRTCDGGFFPLAASARRGGVEGMNDMCRALCPNVETKPFTYYSSGDIDQAVGLDGTPYKSLPNALKFRTKFDSTCTCKPPGKNWVQALAEAEAMLGRSRSDIVVTPEKAEELSRASVAKTAPAKTPPGKTPPGKGAPAKPEADPTLAIEAAANAKSLTAGNDSAGIAANASGTAKTYGLKDGETREQGTANGARKIRVVGPTL